VSTLPFPALEAGPADGRPVVLLHGFPQGKEAWRDVVGPLGDAGLRAVAPDQRGYRADDGDGDSDDVSLPALAADVLALADAMGAPGVHVVGHDWGGAVAWQLAAAHPDRVATATVVAMPHPRAFLRSLAGVQALRSVYAAAFQVPAAPEAVLGTRGGAGLRTMLRIGGLDADRAGEYAARLVDGGKLPGALAWYRTNGPRVLRGVGPSLVPTLYAWPSGDAALGRQAARRTADHVLGPYRFEVLDGWTHWVPEQHPVELAALIVEHVASVPAG